MPKFYRSMFSDGGLPIVGVEASMLGVRLPPNPRADIVPDDAGNVHRGTGGMSVAPAWRDLPYFLIPSRLKHLQPDARGKSSLRCFRFGDGPFVESTINERLTLKPDSDKHATVQPAAIMAIDEYQSALADTRGNWQIDEA